MRKNDAFDTKIVNKRLTKIFIAIFAPDERLPSSATLVVVLKMATMMMMVVMMATWDVMKERECQTSWRLGT